MPSDEIKSTIFLTVQKYLNDTPLLLAGTGLSIPAEIPGMQQLAEHLQKTLNKKYKTDTTWSKISENLSNGIDLESALTDITIEEVLLSDIIKSTWSLVTDADLQFFHEKVIQYKSQALCTLLQKLTATCFESLNIITTNYDRYIEYCCDMCNFSLDNRFLGMYLKSAASDEPKAKDVINLFKVHGSLDTFYNIETKESVCIPLQKNIPNGFIPQIVTPGSNKFKMILETDTYRWMLYFADKAINNAKCYLCIGYGFNDSQIQERIITNIKSGKPIVVVTKSLRDESLALLNDNAKNYVVILDSGNGKTRFIIDKTEYELDGEYWNLEHFLKII